MTPCLKCDGTGKVFNPMSLMLTVGLPVAMMMDADVTKKDCPRCKGTGVRGGGHGGNNQVRRKLGRKLNFCPA